MKSDGYLADAVVGIFQTNFQLGDNIFVNHHLRSLARLPLYDDGKILAGDAEPVGIILNILRLHEIMLEDVHKPCKELIGPLRVNIGVAQFWMLSEKIGETQEETLQLQGYNPLKNDVTRYQLLSQTRNYSVHHRDPSLSKTGNNI